MRVAAVFPFLTNACNQSRRFGGLSLRGVSKHGTFGNGHRGFAGAPRRGDEAAAQELLGRHRERLKRMIALRLDPRLAVRVDASDVVQEALVDAAGKLNIYLHQRPLPFYPWLRQLALERLSKLHQRHMQAQKRSAAREERLLPALNDQSVFDLANRLVASGTSPSRHLQRAELRAHVQATLALLPERDREVLVLRYLEQLSTSEIAAVLGISEGAVKTRHTRALARLCERLGGDLGESKP